MERGIASRRTSIRTAVLLGFIAVLILGCAGQPTVPTTAAIAQPTASPTTPPPSAGVAIPNGKYVAAPQQVADILKLLQADATLSNTERNAIIDSVLVIRGATTYQSSIEIQDGERFVGAQRADEKPFQAGAYWRMRQFDDKTIVVATDCCGIQAYGVRSVDGGFTLRALSPASSPVEAFVRKVVFEASPFKRAP